MTKEEIIRNLKYTMEKHKNNTVNTFDTNISVMCKDILEYLEQEPKTGHWEYRDIANSTITGYWCDQCHIGSSKPYAFCPNCGVKMVGDEDGR